MSQDYGKKIGRALEAVRRLHSDASRLLQDCDGTIGKGKKAVHGSYATHELTWNVRAEYWMAEAVYRYYYADQPSDGLVDGITVSFFDYQQRVDEPLLIVGQLQYHVEEDFQIRSACYGWDIWYAFFDWSGNRQLDAILGGKHIENGRIEWFKVLAVPLYSIQSMQAVEKLMAKVKTTRK